MSTPVIATSTPVVAMSTPVVAVSCVVKTPTKGSVRVVTAGGGGRRQQRVGDAGGCGDHGPRAVRGGSGALCVHFPRAGAQQAGGEPGK
eukprot:927477-Pyramimonas_sp.AAC.1